jgi:TOMM system kinase/cyclase fusion protein
MAPPIRDKVFISYSHKDQEWLAQLQTMMKPLVRSGAVLPWADTMIRTGADWHEQIQTALTTAKVGVMLVSSNFLASDFIAAVELPALLTAAAEEGLQVCWILVSACLYETSGLSRFQAAHDISRPLDRLTAAELNETLAGIAREINRLANIPPPAPPPPPPLPSERRQLTVLFCDLVDAAVLSERLDLEDVSEVIRAYHATCAEVVERFKGHIAQSLGDGLLVYFGYPLAHEDEALRAVRTGLGIVEGMERLNTCLQRERGIRLGVRLGIHTGLVVAGDTRELPILGELNLAARLKELAEPDSIVISSATYRQVQRRFHCQALGIHSLRGLSQPVVVYRVLKEQEDQPAPTPLVGRQQEMGLLLERWALMGEGLGQVVVLSGEAGIGKSRLVQEVKTHVAGEPHTRLECRCSPYYQNSAFYPVIDLLQRVLQLQREDSATEKLGKLEGTLAHYHMSQPDIVRLLASLLLLPLPERYPPLILSAQQQRQRTLETLLTILLTLAANQPVLFIVEDLHWVDPSTLELLNLLIDHVATARILMLLTSRPEFRPPWGFRAHVTPVTLSRLPRTQVEAMVAGVAGNKALPAEVHEQLVVKTDGVPLFVEELTKMVLESGLLREREDRYELTDPLPPLAIPTTLRDSLEARLDRLAAVKEVAQLGAILGREFSYELLQAISPLDEPTLQHGLSQLVEAELLYRQGLPPQVIYSFKHALIQEAAYQSLLKRPRQEHHQRIAQVLAERFPETAEMQPELLAHHFTEAGLSGPAIGYWRRAGQRGIQRSAYVEAISHLTKGLELLNTLPDTSERTLQELILQTNLGPALMATKGFGAPEVQHAYDRARELCRQVGETPQLFPVLRGLATFYIVRAESQTANELAEELLRLAQSAQDPAMLVEAYSMLGTTSFYLGEIASARVHLEQGIALYDPQQHRSHAFLEVGTDPGVLCFIYAAHVLWLLGYPDQALTKSHEALTLAQELSHPFSRAYALDFAALLHRLRREEQAAQERAEAAITLSTKQGFPLWLAIGMILRGGTLAEQGQGSEGIAQMREGLAVFQATGAEVGRPYFLTLLAEGYGRGGQAEERLSILDEALAAVQQTGERWCEAELYRLKGELVLVRFSEDDAEAETCFQQGIAIARRQQAKSLELRAALSLSRLWQRQGKRAEAQQLLAPVYGWFTEGLDTADLQDAKALLDELS